MSATPRPLALPLSVLDLAPVAKGSTPADALNQALDLARHAERLGYHRYWVAEHHNMPGIASSSPAVLLAHVGAGTETIRIGSGGVMLPNHTPLVIAEQFGMLEALHPGRVDLGIGRAPGTDPRTAQALRRSVEGLSIDEFPQHVVQLQGFFNGTFADDHPYRGITAVPALGYPPDLWLLGSSDYSAHLAGLLGLPFSFAHHFSAANTMPALAQYRKSFRPSDRLDAPHAMVAVSVLCAPTEEEARWLAGPSALSFVLLRSGRPGPVPTPQEAADYPYTPTDRAIVADRMTSSIIGDPTQVREQLEALVERTGADELMVVTMAHGHEDRVRSFELLAETWTAVARTTSAPDDRDAIERAS